MHAMVYQFYNYLKSQRITLYFKKKSFDWLHTMCLDILYIHEITLRWYAVIRILNAI